MRKTKSEEIPLKQLILWIILIWILSAVISWFSLENWNPHFAETFNVINSLFSGLALAAIIYTVYLQKKELTLQRQELQYTRGELKRTATAQEFSANTTSDQIRLSNFPYLEFDSGYSGKEKCITIEIKNDNVAFDLDISIFSFISDSDHPYKDFIENFVPEKYKSKYQEVKLLDDILWGLTEKGYYSSISKNRKIIIPFNFPVDQGNYALFIQFRDILGNNYSNFLNFTEFEKFETSENRPFSGIRISPKYPRISRRFEIKNKNNGNYPDYINEVIKSKEASVSLNYDKVQVF